MDKQPGLTQIRFEGFKAFKNLTEIDIDPITLISGVNSGGKTTIIQSLLLARQTLITPYSSPVENALIYDGELVRFASFREVIFGKPNNLEDCLKMGFTVQLTITPEKLIEQSITNRRRYIDIIEYFREYIIQNNVSVIDGLGEIPNMNFFVDFDVIFGNNKSNKVTVVRNIHLNSYWILGCEKYSGPELHIEFIRENLTKAHMTSPNNDLFTGQVQVTLNRFLPSRIVFRRKGRPIIHPGSPDLVFRTIFYPALDVLRKELEDKVLYVGPLRSAPQRPYIRQSVIGLNVGKGGETTIQLLHENWSKLVDFVTLPENDQELDFQDIKPAKIKLKNALGRALKLIGIEQDLKIQKRGESYEALLSLLSEHKGYAPITEVGFGVSQILPIIAVGLLSASDSILLFEQPEIHLHPRAQAGLADFFLALSLTGRRIIVETHSDHLINRLRRRLAESKSNRLDDKASILFVIPPYTGLNGGAEGASVIKSQINRYGEINNWPEGFLAESAIEARLLMLAGAKKRIIEKNK